MDPDVEFLQLSTMLGDAYVHAADDGCTVRLDACQASYNAVWAVERRECIDGNGRMTDYILLRGAYGRYLAAPDKSSCSFPCLRVIAAQRDFDEPVVYAVMWRVFNTDGIITLLSATGSYLEYYSKPRSSSKTRSWKVDIRARLKQPQIMIATKPKWVNLFAFFQRLCYSERKVNWILADNSGNIIETHWGSFQFGGSNISSLEKELGELVPRPTTLCIRAGRHGQPTPICINLPRNKEAVHIVLFLKNTTGCGKLFYPDFGQRERGSGIKLS